MKKTVSSVLVALFIASFSVIPSVMAADDKPATPAAPKVEMPAAPAALTPPPAAADAAADATAVTKAVSETEAAPAEEFDDVAVLKEAAVELEKAGKTELSKKVKDIAEGMDW